MTQVEALLELDDWDELEQTLFRRLHSIQNLDIVPLGELVQQPVAQFVGVSLCKSPYIEQVMGRADYGQQILINI